jgi:hypothetical protein
MGKEFETLIKENATQTIVEDKISYVPEKYAGKKVMVVFSCLVAQENVDRLGQSLERINKKEGFAVRFTGPWAPFNFVDLKGNTEDDT